MGLKLQKMRHRLEKKYDGVQTALDAFSGFVNQASCNSQCDLRLLATLRLQRK